MEDYMTEKVQFVVTSEGWHDSFEDVRLGFFSPSLPMLTLQRKGSNVPISSPSLLHIRPVFKGMEDWRVLKHLLVELPSWNLHPGGAVTRFRLRK